MSKSHHAPAGSDNAMTEIALALAMAFFSIMVLTMVSMGVGPQTAAVNSRGPAADDTAKLAQSENDPAAAIADRPDDTIVLYDGERFLTTEFGEIPASEVSSLKNSGGGRLVLAVPPSLSLVEVLKAQKRLAEFDVVVTTLDQAWMSALERTMK